MTEPTPPPAPITPWNATVDGVRALLPEAKITDNPTPGVRAVTTSQVLTWLDDFSRAVALRLDGWEALRAAPTAEELDAGSPPPRDQLVAFARMVTETGVASITEAARFPERADDGYAAVLWTRYQSALGDLIEWLGAQLSGGGAIDPSGVGAGSVVYSFPEPSFTPATLRF